MEIIDHIGNLELLKLNKTVFLCSRKVPASTVLKCYDWAIAQRKAGNCVIGGFHSQIEKDVLHYLLKGEQPIIVAMARGLKQRLDPELKAELEKGRLLIITPFDKDVKKISVDTARIRNRLMIELAEGIAVGYVKKHGNLEQLISQTGKEVVYIG